MRLIDADRLIDSFTGPGGVFTYGPDVVRAIVSRIDIQPTVDPVKNGVWVQGYPVTCSVCGKPAIALEDNDLKYTALLTDCCPSCGAKLGHGLEQIKTLKPENEEVHNG